MSKKIATVIGATGTQGGAILTALQQIPSPAYHLRAVTRSPDSAKARALVEGGVEIVQADLGDEAALRTALAGSSLVFGITNFWEPFFASGGDATAAQHAETAMGRNLARAAAATTSLETFLWSTSCDFGALTTDERLKAVPIVQSKVGVDTYIRAELPELAAKTTYLVVGFYGSNFGFPSVQPVLVPTTPGGVHVQFGAWDPLIKIPTSGDVAVNLGRFVRAVLARPVEEMRGAVVVVDAEVLTVAEMLATWARVKGVQAEYIRVDLEVYDRLWPRMGALIGQMMQCFGEASGDWGRGFPRDVKVFRKEDFGLHDLVGLEGALKALESG